MSNISFVNGKYLNFKEAKISINDRSIHFSDAVYEVIAVYDKKLVFWYEHLIRLKRSLSLMHINNFTFFETLKLKCNQIIELNKLDEGLIYIQISRGSATRNHNWDKSLKPSLMISAIHKKVFFKIKTVSLISHRDIRWDKCYIKSTSLLPNVLLKQKASDQKAFECVMYDYKGNITEATTSNVWIIKNKNIFTPPLNKNILPGVTRKKVFEISKSLNISAEEKEINYKHLGKADGVFLTNSSSLLLTANKIDNINLGKDKNKISNLIFNELLRIIRKNDVNKNRI